MLLTTAIALIALQPTEIVYVRHAETQANATGNYNSRTLNAFSSRGERQVSAVTQKLKFEVFDAILVSPSPRALKTVAPYLRATGKTAEIWPELYECCHQPKSQRSKPASVKMQFGPKIEWHASLEGLFHLRPGGERYIIAPTFNDGMRQIKQLRTLLVQRYGGSGKKILVVGHSIVGGHLLAMLTGKRLPVQNAAPIRIAESKPGLFQVKSGS
jgi:broad specificity phosphatase PhoE